MLSFNCFSTALVVGEQANSGELVEAVLESRGLRVLKAPNAATALSLINAGPVRLLIDNIGGVAADSSTLIRAVRALPDQAKAHLPALALTARARPEELREALNGGFDAYLPMPAKRTDFLELVEVLLLVPGVTPTAAVRRLG